MNLLINKHFIQLIEIIINDESWTLESINPYLINQYILQTNTFKA